MQVSVVALFARLPSPPSYSLLSGFILLSLALVVTAIAMPPWVALLSSSSPSLPPPFPLLVKVRHLSPLFLFILARS